MKIVRMMRKMKTMFMLLVTAILTIVGYLILNRPLIKYSRNLRIRSFREFRPDQRWGEVYLGMYTAIGINECAFETKRVGVRTDKEIRHDSGLLPLFARKSEVQAAMNSFREVVEE